MRKYSNCRETDKLTDKLERVVVDSGNGNIKEEAEVDNLINSEETGPPTNTETETDENKEEVESINGEKTEAPDNNEEEEETTETNNDNVTETEVFESINNENAQNDDSPLVAVVKPIKNNKKTEDNDNEGRKKRKRN